MKSLRIVISLVLLFYSGVKAGAAVEILSESMDLGENFTPLHYKITLDLRDAQNQKFSGEVHIKVRPNHLNLEPLRIFAQKDLVVSDVQINQKPVLVMRTFATVEIAESVPQQEEFELSLKFQGTKSLEGMHFIREHGQTTQVWTHGEPTYTRFWLPSFDQPKFKTTSEFHIYIPKKWKTLANGKLLGVRTKKDFKIYDWKESVPLPTYLFSVFAGPLDVMHINQGNISYWYPSGDLFEKNQIKRGLKVVPDMLDFYSKLLGPYPFEKFAVGFATDFLGGMENASAVTYSRMNSSPRDGFDAALMAHEMAHHWFGDLVTCQTWTDLWLNEGFANYFDIIFWEKTKNPEILFSRIENHRERYFAQDFKTKNGLQNGVLGPLHNPETLPTRMFGHSSALSYDKAALVLHQLRFVMGDDQFFQGLRWYLRKFRFKTADSEDLRLALEESASKNGAALSLEKFWKQWVYGSGIPQFHYNWQWDGKKLLIEVNQNQDPKLGFFETPINVLVGTTSGEKIIRAVIQAERKTAIKIDTLDLAEAPQFVVLNPDHWVLGVSTADKSEAEWKRILSLSKWPMAQIDAIHALEKVFDLKLAQATLEVATNEMVRQNISQAFAKNAGVEDLSLVKAFFEERLASPLDRERLGAFDIASSVTGAKPEATSAFEDSLISNYLNDPIWMIGSVAGNVLMTLDSKKAQDVFMNEINTEPRRHYNYLVPAILGLGISQRKDAAPRLRALFSEGLAQANFMRAITGGAFAMLHDTDAVPLLGETLLKEEQPDLELSYIKALKALKDKRAHDYLEKVYLVPHRLPEVQKAAREAASAL